MIISNQSDGAPDEYLFLKRKKMNKEFVTRPIKGYCVRFKEERTIKLFGQKVYVDKSRPSFLPTRNYCKDVGDCPYGQKCSIYWGVNIDW